MLMAAKSSIHEEPSGAVRRRKNRLNSNYSHLPNGPRKRKAQKVKNDLIRSAKIRKDYAKMQQLQDMKVQPTSMELHPDRQAALEKRSETKGRPTDMASLPRPRIRPMPFQKESIVAQQRNEERNRRRRELEAVEVQKAVKQKNRENFRKSLEKARRPDRHGQRRLGRESKLLPKMVEGLLHRLERRDLKAEAVS